MHISKNHLQQPYLTKMTMKTVTRNLLLKTSIPNEPLVQSLMTVKKTMMKTTSSTTSSTGLTWTERMWWRPHLAMIR